MERSIVADDQSWSVSLLSHSKNDGIKRAYSCLCSVCVCVCVRARVCQRMQRIKVGAWLVDRVVPAKRSLSSMGKRNPANADTAWQRCQEGESWSIRLELRSKRPREFAVRACVQDSEVGTTMESAVDVTTRALNTCFFSTLNSDRTQADRFL